MLCYPCAQNGVERQAVALCTSCSAGLCQEHLHETATQLASDNPFAGCRHDTWTAAPGRPERLATRSWLYRAVRRDHTSRPALPPRAHKRAAADRLRDELAREAVSPVSRRRGDGR
jgi:Uncharacterized protein conserved in archaea (DUF2180)